MYSGIGCSYCQKKPKKLLICMGCKYAHYCDAECQKNGWGQHKPLCKAIKKYPKEADEMKSALKDVKNHSDAIIMSGVVGYHNMIKLDDLISPCIEVVITDYSNDANFTLSVDLVNNNVKYTAGNDVIIILLKYHSDIKAFRNPGSMITAPLSLIKNAHNDMLATGELDKYAFPALIVIENRQMLIADK